MIIVDAVQRVEIVRPLPTNEFIIGNDGLLIGANHGCIIADQHVDMLGHVYQVAQARHRGPQVVCIGQRLRRRRRGLHDVDVQMAQCRVLGPPLQRRFEYGNDFASVFAWFTGGAPVLPRLQVH